MEINLCHPLLYVLLTTAPESLLTMSTLSWQLSALMRQAEREAISAVNQAVCVCVCGHDERDISVRCFSENDDDDDELN